MSVTRSSGPIRVVSSVRMGRKEGTVKKKVPVTKAKAMHNKAKPLKDKVKPAGKPVGIPKMRKGYAK